eukprot:CAMPEP_0202694256 /NCGR_PEP_ID=MMETSP1385-20130828/8162_1 /ASSEMBLY_ACC=CAM_ASM_000861 /TAXON_ID=933848 /ORGANISM="Elphidium margaritaceum" /LENGTH=511 /DNA_ID=CAMNT_0049350069 /DNA_START=29 /DNA_END=1564 /DNA_ORIENTATION=-
MMQSFKVRYFCNRLQQSYSTCRTQKLLSQQHRLKFATSALLEKNPEISNNDLSAFLDSCQTKEYDRKSMRAQSALDRFGDLRRKKLEQMTQQPEAYHPVIFSLLSAKNSSDILDVLHTMDRAQFSTEESWSDSHQDDEDRHTHPSIHRVYSKAIRCCADLGEKDVCWQIFEQCKQDKILSNELYNTMMWLCMYERRDLQAFQRVIELYKELQSVAESDNLCLHPRTFSTLLNSCTKAGRYSEGLRIYTDLKRNRKEMLQNARVFQAGVWLLCKTGDAKQAMKELKTFVTASQDDSVWCHSLFCVTAILHAIARRLYHGAAREDYLELAEECFTKSLQAFFKHKVEIPVSLINAMIQVYANCNDYESCLALLQRMLGAKNVLPAPTATTFEHALRSLLDYEDRDLKQQHMRHVVELMDKAEIARTWHLYNVLIEVCKDDLEAAKQWYSEMLNEKKPNNATMKWLVSVALTHFQTNANRDELRAFTQWIIEQHQKYNFPVDVDLKEALKNAIQ